MTGTDRENAPRPAVLASDTVRVRLGPLDADLGDLGGVVRAARGRYRAVMVWTVSELRQHLDASGVAVPLLQEAGATFAGVPAYACEVGGTDGFRIWYGLRELHAQSGWWPVLTGAGARLAASGGAGPRLIGGPLERGRRLDAEGLLAARLAPQRHEEGTPEARDHFSRLRAC